MNKLCAALIVVTLAGCAGVPPVIHIAKQPAAPVQVIRVEPSGDNLLGSVIVKNTTDHYVQGFTVIWSVLPPCGATALTSHGQSVYAEARGAGALPPGIRWGDRPLKPHEETEISSLVFTREELSKIEESHNVGKPRLQIGVAYVDFQPPATEMVHFGPDWRDMTFETNHVFETEDAGQVCD
jgi:hypothetical protein